MVKQVKTRRMAAKRSPETKARALWLASLGAASLTRKQGIKLYAAMIEEGRGLQSRMNEAAKSANGQIVDAVASLRGRIDNVVVPVLQRAEATYVVLKDEVSTRLQPVLARFGIAGKRSGARRVVKTRAVKAKQAGKRVVRRTRKAA